MDIISQLQEQVNTIAALAFNTFGTLQRDAPPVRLSPNYPEPPATNPTEDSNNVAEQPKQMSAAFVKAAKQVNRIFLLFPNININYLLFVSVFISFYVNDAEVVIELIQQHPKWNPTSAHRGKEVVSWDLSSQRFISRIN